MFEKLKNFKFHNLKFHNLKLRNNVVLQYIKTDQSEKMKTSDMKFQIF